MENPLDYVGIGQRIRLARKRLNLTQFELAELASLTPTNISHIERGANKVSLPALVSIANVLRVSIDYLLYDSLEASNDADLPSEPKLIWELRDCTQEEMDLFYDIIIPLKKFLRKSRNKSC